MKPRDLAKVLIAVREDIDDDCSVQKLLILMAVAESGSPGTTQQALQERARTGRSNTSKLVADLTHLTYRKKPGPNLIRSTPDPQNLRTRIITLTEKGAQVLKKVMASDTKSMS
ncbi:MAG: hypothetical protein HYV17_15470 [Xanthomonadales bacterium]|nr:hypothetical protein [Xanthomonadales bacterium]